MARPKGSTNVKTVQQVEAPRCPDCGSTEAVVMYTDVQEYSGTTDDGQRVTWDGKGRPFNRVVKRRTQCRSCERTWIVRSLEYVPGREHAPPADDH